MSHQDVKDAIDLYRSNTDFCVFDLETTGKDAKKGSKTLQIASRRYRVEGATRTPRLVGELNCFINDPTITEIDPFLTEKIHRIGMIDIRSVAAAAAKGAKLLSPKEAWRLDPDFTIDTLLIARTLWDLDNAGINKAGYKLRSLATRLNVKTAPTLDHDALGDINTTWLLFLAMQPEITKYGLKFFPKRGEPDQYRGSLGTLRASIPGR